MKRTHWRPPAATMMVLAACLLAGCGDEKPPPAETPTRNEAEPPAPGELTAPEARVYATKLANEAFTRARLTDAEGNRILGAKLSSSKWKVAEKRGDVWVFQYSKVPGLRADVSFGLDGSDPAVDVAYQER